VDILSEPEYLLILLQLAYSFVERIQEELYFTQIPSDNVSNIDHLSNLMSTLEPISSVSFTNNAPTPAEHCKELKTFKDQILQRFNILSQQLIQQIDGTQHSRALYFFCRMKDYHATSSVSSGLCGPVEQSFEANSIAMQQQENIGASNNNEKNIRVPLTHMLAPVLLGATTRYV
jgi:hypothetical protein